ncbi:MAG TPA: DsbA family protein [Gemmatimonadales bacterium]|jgi:2-hydroxychromene-2-carboxylate isomerase|nr:DsbA family protein [Gemmatimonadales bacterium]
MAHILDFYFFYGSIHSYLSVMRIGALGSAAGVEVRWQPFNLREILIEQNNTAFTKNEVKMNYFWHDVERRAARHKIPFAGRAPYPADPNLLALRVGLIAAQEKWCEDYSRATFHQWFIGRRAPGVDDHVERVLALLDKSPAPIIARAKSAEGERLLKMATDAARKLGIFGAPTFAIGPEIFWGDDRLEDALAFASRR